MSERPDWQSLEEQHYFRVARVLGGLLRDRRQDLGWTRAVLRKRLASEMSLQTLATYELGTRLMTVPRLLEICAAEGVEAWKIVQVVEEKLATKRHIDDTPGDIVVNLHALVHLCGSQMAPLGKWARARLQRQERTDSTWRTIPVEALASLSLLCNIQVLDMLGKIRKVHVEHCRKGRQAAVTRIG